MIVLTVIAFIFGLIVGSFLNSVIFRLKAGKSFVKGHSHCPQCQKKLRWYELIPIFSWLWQLGRCRQCEGKIDKQYPLVELVAGILFALSMFVEMRECYNVIIYLNECSIADYFAVFRDWVMIAFLIVIFVYDLRWQLILDQVSLPAMIVALLLNLELIILLSQDNFSAAYIGKSLIMLVLAAIVGGGFFLLQFYISKGKWIGGGDIRLGALMGLILGWPQIIWALILAYFIGALVSVGLIAGGKKTWSSQIPFGTFLSIATLLILFWGNEMVNWYLGVLI